MIGRGDVGRPRQPAFQFYTGDWLKDPQLSACTPATRGVWVDCVAAMWENGRSGKISGTYDQLARICRCDPEQMRESVDELRATKTATVTIRNGKVTVTNRRMAREDKARRQNALRQKRHREKKPSNAKVTSPSSKASKDSTDSVTPLPPGLDTIRFRTVWVEWLAYRREIKKTVKPITQAKQLKKLDGYGEAGAIARLERSMANGWTGFDYEPDQRGGNNAGGRRSPREAVGTDDERRAQIAKLD